MKVFVYGTLKRGYGNHRVISPFVTTEPQQQTLRGFKMIDLGAFPAIIPDEGNRGVIHGEVYDVPDEALGPLDTLEGYPILYNRTTVNTEEGENVLVYFMEQDRMGSRVVEDGIW